MACANLGKVQPTGQTRGNCGDLAGVAGGKSGNDRETSGHPPSSFRQVRSGGVPAFVTFTGADDSTDISRMAALSSRYPIEWGILFSPKRQGGGRYPSINFVRRVTRSGLRLAAHLCGGYSREIIETGWCRSLTDDLVGYFSRFQINTVDPTVDPGTVKRFAEDMNIAGTGILQTRHGFPYDPRVDWLYDCSGGRGNSPAAWPVPGSDVRFCGYAGGLGPTNIAAELTRIQATHPQHTPYWIDMESQVRTDDRFDLDKCETVCRVVFGS